MAHEPPRCASTGADFPGSPDLFLDAVDLPSAEPLAWPFGPDRAEPAGHAVHGASLDPDARLARIVRLLDR